MDKKYKSSICTQFNLGIPNQTQIEMQALIKNYKNRIMRELKCEERDCKSTTIKVSFGIRRSQSSNKIWLQENYDKYIANTPNEYLVEQNYLSQVGFIFCMIYTPDGEFLIVGHSSGMIQVVTNMNGQKEILEKYINNILSYYENDQCPKIWYPMFFQGVCKERNANVWVKDNYIKFLKDTPNNILYNRWFLSEYGAIMSLVYSPNGNYIIVGHSSGLIQMRHGSTGTVLCTLRNIQYPPKPVYALEYSKQEERVCYAACMDGAVYRIEVPHINVVTDDPPEYCIRADPTLECLNTQFYGAPGISSSSTPFITQRIPALSLGLTADQTRMVVGYADASIKVYDLETQEMDLTYKVQKLRLQFIPKKLQRLHSNQVCALRCHDQNVFMFASGAWDKTLRIWDIRCKIGCVSTFEGVDVCADSIDLNRNQCIVGSWQPTDALTVWDIVAKKKLNIVRVQNRRPDVDGEYIYTCRYWRSDFNRKGKYALIGGSGTNCLEVINLHNRYISCSYPVVGNILAVTSHQERIAFGGTAPVLNIVSFHDPKHENHRSDIEVDSSVWTPGNEFHDYSSTTIAQFEG